MEIDAIDFSGDLPVNEAPVMATDELVQVALEAVVSGASEEGASTLSQEFLDWREQMEECNQIYELQGLGLVIRNAANLLPEAELVVLRELYEARSLVLKAKVRTLTRKKAEGTQGGRKDVRV